MIHPNDHVRILVLTENEDYLEKINQELKKIEFLLFDIETARSQPEFMKKVLKFEPNVVIASHELSKYSAFDAHDDLRRALPFSVFILIGSDFSKQETDAYMQSDIDSFLHPDNFSFLPFAVAQGLNKKRAEKHSHQSQMQMIESQQRLRAVFNNDQNAIFIIGLKNEIIDLNPAAIEMLEKATIDALTLKDFTKFIDRDDLKKFRSAHATAFRGKKSTEEFMFSLPKKVTKQASVNFVPVKNEEGHVTSLMLICKDVTEILLFRQKFKMSEERFIALANNAPVGIYYNNVEGKCLFVNKKWSEYSGLSFRQSIGDGWRKAIHPDDREHLEKLAAENKKNNAGFIVDYRSVDTSGEIKWLRGKTSPFIDEKGKLLGYIGTVSDITNDKLHALEIIEAHKRQNMLMTLADIAIWEKDLTIESDTPIWSENMFTLFEREKNSGAPTNREFLYTYVHPDDHAFIKSMFNTYIPGNTTDEFFYKAITNSDKTKFLRAMISSELDINGKPSKVLGFVQDVTSQRKNEAQLKVSEEKFRYLFNNSPDAIYIEDYDGNILEVNEQACEIQGMTKEELTGKNIVDLAPATLKEEISKKFKMMSQGDISMLHSFSWNKSGKKIPIQIKQNRIEYNLKPALLLHVRRIEIL